MKAKIYYSTFLVGSVDAGFKFIPDNTHKLMDIKEVKDSTPESLEGLFFHYNWMWNEGICPDDFSHKVRNTEYVEHSSMSVGDVIEIDGTFYLVAPIGFEELEQTYVRKNS